MLVRASQRGRASCWGTAMTDSTKPAGEQSFLDRYFGLTASGTNVRTEFIAGLTTFLTMVYIVFVNPTDPRQCGHGQGRGVRRDLHRGRGLDVGDGALCQLSDRARARHGPQCLLRLHRRADLQIYLAAGARRRVLLGRHFLPDLDLQAARIRHQFDPEKSQARDLRRRRALPRHHRARGGEDRGGPSGDAGHARRSQAMAGDAVPRSASC